MVSAYLREARLRLIRLTAQNKFKAAILQLSNCCNSRSSSPASPTIEGVQQLRSPTRWVVGLRSWQAGEVTRRFVSIVRLANFAVMLRKAPDGGLDFLQRLVFPRTTLLRTAPERHSLNHSIRYDTTIMSFLGTSEFSRLMGSGEYSDMKLVCDGREFQVHKVVMCTQSRVLSAAIDGDFAVRKNQKRTHQLW